MSAQKGKRTKPLARLGLPSGTAERSEERAGGERPDAEMLRLTHHATDAV